ncbi:MAG: DUF1841 family protein [Betaproteobacteria bacterium]|nr:DUF1841 family protein [Betaproteobacteria bacterium]
MFDPSREQSRLFFCETWRAYRAGEALEGLQTLMLPILIAHPKYHPLLESPEEALEWDCDPEDGHNPFLHLSLHLTLEEQLSIDQPAGIRAAYHGLLRQYATHEAQHHVLTCLSGLIWEMLHHSRPFDSEEYLKRIRRAPKKH